MNITFALDGKTRDKPVADDYLAALDRVLRATDPRLGARITSGGQAPKGSGGKRTGSTRHDVDETGHSHTSDLVLTLDGKDIRPGDDKNLYARFLKNAAPVFPGIGHYDWGVHVGGGSTAMWGPDTTSKTLDPIFAQAITEGRSGEQPKMVSRKKITDPALLAELNGAAPKRKKVSDPAILEQLNGTAEKQADPSHPEFDGSNVPGYDPATGEVKKSGLVDKIGAFLTGVADLPVVGPAVKAGQRNIAAGIVAPFSDESFGDIRDDMADIQRESVEDNPGYALAGNVVGTVGTLIPAGATGIGGRLLGITGNSLAARIAASGASNAIMSGGDTAVRGGDAIETAKSAGIGGTIGALIPGAGAALNGLGRAVRDTAAPRLNALLRPGYEAERRVGSALQRDAGNSAAPLLNPADEASAAVNNQQLLNVDRGGETTRALARSAANTDPEARALIEKTASDRFGSQGERAQSFIQRITGGATDDLALQDALKAASRKANKPAYDRAFGAEAAQDMATPELMGLLRSPTFRGAAKAAESRGADRSAVEGFETVRNPFVFDEAGNASMKEGVRPTLQFWDQVKRNLDADIGKAQRAGDKTMVADLSALKTKMVAELDKAVPEYAAARQGAAAFFGAEDALEAGKKFVTQNRTLPETERALAKMTPAERSTFAVGFASEMKDAIAQSGDRTNVINKIFGSEQARAKIRLALGSKAYGEFEQFVKVEHAIDMLRGAMGNSTTARQLAELGLAGGAGVGATALTGDWKQGLTAAVLTGLARRGGARIDEKVTKRVAELLLSDDPAALQKAVTLASTSPKASAALNAIQTALSSALKGIGQVTTRPERKPLEITVTPKR